MSKDNSGDSVKDYYDKNAKEIIKAVKDDEFSASELNKLLENEEENKNRVTVKKAINNKLDEVEEEELKDEGVVSIDWRIPVAFIAGVIVTSLIFYLPDLQISTNNTVNESSGTNLTGTVDLIVLNDEDCSICDASWIEPRVNQDFNNVEVSNVDVDSTEGQEYVQNLGINSIPAAFFTSSVEDAGNFSMYEQNQWITPSGDYYLLSIQGTKLLNKEESSNSIVSLFVMSECPYGAPAQQTMLNTKEQILGFELNVHYIGEVMTESECNATTQSSAYCQSSQCFKQGSKYYCSLHGESEVRNDIAQLCAMKYAGNWTGFMNAHIENDWNNTKAMEIAGLNETVMNNCIESEGWGLFEEDVKVAKEYGVSASPTYVLDNDLIVTSSTLGQYQTTMGGLICSLHPTLEGCENVDQIETAAASTGSC